MYQDEDHGKYSRIMAIVGRIVNESIMHREPYDPRFANGRGSAYVDHSDLKRLGEAYRDLHKQEERLV